MKKIFALLLAICLIACLLPTTVLAQDAPPARFVFANKEGVSDLEVVINQGDAPVYLRTIGEKATLDGASADEYEIKVTYNAGENPKVYLNGAELKAWGDDPANKDYAITVGSPNPEDPCNNLSVDIVIEKNATLKQIERVNCSPLIKSFITGTLTITRTKGTLQMGYRIAHDAAISVVGDIVLKDCVITMGSGWTGRDRANAIQSAQGNIIIDGAKLSITTKNDDHVVDGQKLLATDCRVLMTEAEGKDIIIQNGATLAINMSYSGKAFSTKGKVIIKDSNVKALATGGAGGTGVLFEAAGLEIEGYANGYDLSVDEGEYDAAKLGTYLKFIIKPNETEEEGTTPATEETTPATEESAPATEPVSGEKPKTDSKTIILVVALVVIVAVVAAAAVVLLKRRKVEEEIVEIIEEVEE